MSQIRKLALAPVALLALACGGTDEPSMQSVSGFWTATRLEYVSVANSSVKVDLIASGGTATLDLSDNGNYTAVITPAGGAAQTTTGTWSYTADTFTMIETGSSGDMTFDMSIGNDTMTLTGANTDYDFDDNGTDEPAKLNISLVR